MRRAIDGLKLAPQHLLIEAKRLKEVTIPQQAIIKGDAGSASIAAASILAKVSRDALMRTLDECHSGYGFADHKLAKQDNPCDRQNCSPDDVHMSVASMRPAKPLRLEAAAMLATWRLP